MESEIFDVGQTLSIEMYYKSYLAIRLLGLEKGLFLMTTTASAQGDPSGIKSGDGLKIRCLKDGNAYGFISDVIHVQFFPFPLMFIKYPANIECVKLRIAPRFKIDIPAILSDASGAVIVADATMLDISEGGCGLKAPAKDGILFSPEALYTVTFQALDKELHINCEIKQFKEGKESHALGMEFKNISEQSKQTLSLFLDFIKKLIRV